MTFTRFAVITALCALLCVSAMGQTSTTTSPSVLPTYVGLGAAFNQIGTPRTNLWAAAIYPVASSVGVYSSTTPWREFPISAESLAEELRKTAEAIIGTGRVRECDEPHTPTKKPCGRLAWTFYLQPEGVEGPYIDLSVLPAGASEEVEKGKLAEKILESQSRMFAKERDEARADNERLRHALESIAKLECPVPVMEVAQAALDAK
jgi:hypothetical protein